MEAQGRKLHLPTAAPVSHTPGRTQTAAGGCQSGATVCKTGPLSSDSQKDEAVVPVRIGQHPHVGGPTWLRTRSKDSKGGAPAKCVVEAAPGFSVSPGSCTGEGKLERVG